MKWIAARKSPEALNAFPSTPGVYIYMANRIPIYIGKSNSLKARVKSHYQNTKLNTKEKSIWDATTTIKYTTTDNEFKALLLEAQLIQKHLPRYNVELKDNKSYLYISIDSGNNYPKIRTIRATDITALRSREISKYQFFGPFPSSRITENVIRTIRKLIPFCTNKNMSKRGCFYSRIGLCNPCPNNINKLGDEEKTPIKREYRKNIRDVISILEGKTDPVVRRMRLRMNKLSHKQEYEKALIIRSKIENFERWITTHSYSNNRALTYNQSELRLNSLTSLLKQYFPKITKLHRIECYDASTLSLQNSTASMVVLTDGAIDKSQYRKFKIKNPRARSDFGMLKEALERRFHNKWESPDLIIMDGGKPQVRAARDVLDKLDHNIPLIGIAKGPDRIVLGIKHLPTIKPDTFHPGFNLIKLIRDESHRFATKYNTKLREKSLV